jgi:hypothetical protein
MLLHDMANRAKSGEVFDQPAFLAKWDREHCFAADMIPVDPCEQMWGKMVTGKPVFTTR